MDVERSVRNCVACGYETAVVFSEKVAATGEPKPYRTIHVEHDRGGAGPQGRAECSFPRHLA